jgi:hypothetical protein
MSVAALKERKAPAGLAGAAKAATAFAHSRPSSIAQRPLNSPGKPLEAETRAFFEKRFQHDFSRVRIHADSDSAVSARTLGALAYTVGSHVAFAHDQYKPATAKGRHLLAHELTHVAQQSDAAPTEHRGAIPVIDAAQECEAEQISSHVLAGGMARRPRSGAALALARFSDTSHHVIEEAALPGAGFTPEQMRSIERGNVQRDYSQVGALGNAVLLGQAQGFGGYRPAEHFDNFIFDAVTNRWRTRGTGQQKFLHLDPNQPDPSPIDYIRGQLAELARAGMTEDSLVHLGNAFHTVEDFFAHSNFIELARNDRRFGSELVTGSFEDNPANSAASLAHTLGAVSTPTMQGFYEKQAEAQTQLTEPRSHSRIAKDTPSAAGFTEARRLAALVIEDLGTDIVRVMQNPRADARQQSMEEIVMTKIVRYLRPPDAEHDPWWTQLVRRGGATMDARLAEAERRTPVTVNQAPFSPLRNLEASRDSRMAIPLGVAVPAGGSAWFQAGAGVTRPLATDSSLPGPADVPGGIPFIGAQITGRF